MLYPVIAAKTCISTSIAANDYANFKYGFQASTFSCKAVC
jgi:hypothetical protein